MPLVIMEAFGGELCRVAVCIGRAVLAYASIAGLESSVDMALLWPSWDTCPAVTLVYNHRPCAANYVYWEMNAFKQALFPDDDLANRRGYIGTLN